MNILLEPAIINSWMSLRSPVAGKIIELWDFPLPALITGGYMVFIYIYIVMCVYVYLLSMDANGIWMGKYLGYVHGDINKYIYI